MGNRHEAGDLFKRHWSLVSQQRRTKIEKHVGIHARYPPLQVGKGSSRCSSSFRAVCIRCYQNAENVGRCWAKDTHTRHDVLDVACRQEFLHFSCYVLGVVHFARVEKVVVDNGLAFIPCTTWCCQASASNSSFATALGAQLTFRGIHRERPEAPQAAGTRTKTHGHTDGCWQMTACKSGCS